MFKSTHLFVTLWAVSLFLVGCTAMQPAGMDPMNDTAAMDDAHMNHMAAMDDAHMNHMAAMDDEHMNHMAAMDDEHMNHTAAVDDDHMNDTAVAAPQQHAHGQAHHADSGEHQSSPPIAGAPEIRVIANEFAFIPDRLELVSGQPVNIVLVNEGTLPHELDLAEFGFHAHVEAGETITVGLIPTASGEFEFGCHIAGHYESGMFGTLTVTDP